MMPYDYDYSSLVDKLITWSSLISAEFGGASFDGAGTTYELSGAHGRLVRVHLSGYVSLGLNLLRKLRSRKPMKTQYQLCGFVKPKMSKTIPHSKTLCGGDEHGTQPYWKREAPHPTCPTPAAMLWRCCWLCFPHPCIPMLGIVAGHASDPVGLPFESSPSPSECWEHPVCLRYACAISHSMKVEWILITWMGHPKDVRSKSLNPPTQIQQKHQNQWINQIIFRQLQGAFVVSSDWCVPIHGDSIGIGSWFTDWSCDFVYRFSML